MLKVLLSLIFVTIFGVGVIAQAPKVEALNRQISLNVSVWNEDYKFRTDLSAQDFEIRSAGKALRVESLSRRKNEPVSVGIVLDTTLSMYGYADLYRRAPVNLISPVLRGLRLFVEESNPDNEYFVIRMGEETELELEKTTDTDKMLNYLDSLTGIEPKGYRRGRFSALGLAFDKIADAKSKTRVILLVSALSDPRAVDTGFEKFKDVIRSGSVQLYSVRVWYGGGGVTPYPREQDVVDDSGGIVFNANTPSNIENIFGIVADELKSQYELRFSPDGMAKSDKWNKIDVRVFKTEPTGQKLFIKAKRGYQL